jgi:hypothetical protein
MVIEWTDSSSYSRSDTDRTPTSWTAQVGRFRLVVHRHIHHPPDVWLASCNDLLNKVELKSRDIKYAQQEALMYLHGILQNAIRCF